jgi:GntR family transcriptional repressor for pyruvate dehydrogenase complex
VATAVVVNESRSSVQQVVATLRERILRGEFTSGILPSQGKLGAELGVSRPVVREAMRALESQGLLEVSQGRRPRVRPAGSETLIENTRTLLSRGAISFGHLIELRKPLESEVAALAARRATPQLLDRLRESVATLRAARGAADQLAADRRFHELLAEASGNPLFQAILQALADLLDASRRHTFKVSGVQSALRGHTAILSAVENEDREGARRAMLDHLTEASLALSEANARSQQATR